MSKKYYVYKITNILNNKIYIGQSMSPTKRWKRHTYLSQSKIKSNQYIHRAMNKYGVYNFIFDIVKECNSKDEVNQVEFDLINEYKTRDKNFGYNIKPGGYKRGGWKHSEETKAKQKTNWKNIHTPESIIKATESRRGYSHSKETKKKMSEAGKNNLHNGNYKKGRSRPEEETNKSMITAAKNYGSKVCNATDCYRADGSKVNGIRYCSMHEQRFRKYGTTVLPPRVAHNKGKPLSNETKRKLSESLTGRKIHNKIEFTKDQIALIMSYTVSANILTQKFSVSQNVIKRVRKENKKY